LDESFLEKENMSMASRALIEVANTATNLKPSPIEPSWIIEGNPVAESCLLSKSADGQVDSGLAM